MTSQVVIFKNIKKLLVENLPRKVASSEHSIAIHYISMVDYTVLAFVCAKLCAWEASGFCDLKKISSCDSVAFYSVLTQANFCVCVSFHFKMCLVRTTVTNLSK